MTFVHFGPSPRHIEHRDPMCGYMPDDDSITDDTKLVTCPECLDWVMPTPDDDGEDPASA